MQLIGRDTCDDITDEIIEDLCNRKGFDWAWDSTDEDVQKEIRAAWTAIIEKYLKITERA